MTSADLSLTITFCTLFISIAAVRVAYWINVGKNKGGSDE